MMSPRLPRLLLSHARRARRMRTAAVAVVAACAMGAVVATAATPVATAADTDAAARQASRSWSPFFDGVRPVAAIDSRRFVVTFADPSLGEWVAVGSKSLTARQRAAWLARAGRVQQERLDALAGAGVQFTVEHRYLRVLNGASIVVHGDGAQLLRSVDGVEQLTPVRTLWPTGAATAGSLRADADDSDRIADGAAGAAAVAGVARPEGGSAARRPGAVRVSILDTGIDAAHPAVAGHVVDGWDATRPTDGAERRRAPVADEHGTAVAGAVLRGSGPEVDIELEAVQVLQRRATQDGGAAILGDSDDLLAALEHVVDPDGDGDASDASDIAVVAATAPFAGFADAPEDRAVHGAAALGTLVVAAAGNDGASGDGVGTVGGAAASRDALVVGAVDLRGRTPAASVRVRGDGIDQSFDGAPVLTANRAESLPSGELAMVVVEAGGDVVDYLDSELRSRVSGAVALVAARDDVTVARQVRAAADAGAIAVLVAAGDSGAAAAGTIDAGGADIPAIGIPLDDARALRDALNDGTRLSLTLEAGDERNPHFGTVAGFSSSGPSLAGAARPDLLAPGVGMLVAGPGSSWRTVSGTSIAAGWGAGQAAAVLAAHPTWDPDAVRSALLGTATALGSDGDRPSVSLQGAGVADAARAAAAAWIAGGAGRIDFGAVTPGSEHRSPFLLAAIGGEFATGERRVLVDDGGEKSDVGVSIDGDELVLDVPADAAGGSTGGWLVLPDAEIRIPWSAVVRDPARESVPVSASVDAATIVPSTAPGAFASTMTVVVGGDGAAGGSLGIDALQRLEVRIIDPKGRDRGRIGGLDQVLPGRYSFGITGTLPGGKPMSPGSWTLRIRSIPATDADGSWRSGPEVTVRVARRAARP